MIKKLESIQLLRVIAFMMVFIHHTGFFAFNGLGYAGTSIFFAISGFTMTISYWDRIDELSFAFSSKIKFVYSKIHNLYYLHVILSFAVIVFDFTGNKKESLASIIMRVLTNILLIQEWLPIPNSANRSINGVSWFLCSIVFAYYVFPHILYRLKKIEKLRKAIYMLIFLQIAQIIICVCAKIVVENLNTLLNSSEYNCLEWIIYKYPPIRLIDFCFGSICGYIFLAICEDIKYAKSFYLRITNIICIILSMILGLECCVAILNLHPFEAGITNYVGDWWIYTILFMMTSNLLVLFLALRDTCNDKKVRAVRIEKYVMYSKYGFLIHYVVFKYITVLDYHLPKIGGKYFDQNYGWIMKLIIGFIITYMISRYVAEMYVKKNNVKN